MILDLPLIIVSFGIGAVVGLTGMGGGALLTPVLVLFFNIPPLTAVSSDLAASAVMKPVGAVVHLRHGTVHFGLVKWLCVGSIPGAFTGVLIARWLGRGEAVQDIIRSALGIALLIAAAGLIIRAYLRLVEHAQQRDGRAQPLPRDRPRLVVRPFPTTVLGLLGGLVVGMTSVGSGSLMIIALMAVYPNLKASQLVGTDLVQAVPLVASAALGHAVFGDLQLPLAASMLVGCIPGVWLGAHLSAIAPGGIVRRALAFVLLASGLKLLDVSTATTGFMLLAALVIAPLLWMVVRRRHGFPALASSFARARVSAALGRIRAGGQRRVQARGKPSEPPGTREC